MTTQSNAPGASVRIDSIEIFRGLAALSVAWFHLTFTLPEHWVRYSGAYGWLGVEVFFVISGFVIPLSIHRRYAGFRARDFAPYMARRLIRLEPPYLLSVVMVVVLWEITVRMPGFAGEAAQWSIPRLLVHVAYAIPLTSFGWLQPVYWTLAYEFVFYIAAGVFFSVLGHRGPVRWPLGIAAMVVLCLAEVLPPLSLLFVIGISAFRRISLQESWYTTLAVLAIAALAMVYLGHRLEAAAGVATAIAILLTARLSLSGRVWRPFVALGAISYSLYLVHFPIGRGFVNLFGRFTPETPFADLCLSLGGLAVSLGFAVLFWLWIERPAIALARKVGAALERRNAKPVAA